MNFKTAFLFIGLLLWPTCGFSYELSWVKCTGGTQDDHPLGVVVDPAGNVYTTGGFTSTVDFDPGPSTFNLTASSTDLYVQKLDASGNFVWAVKIGDSGGEGGLGIVRDTAGYLYIVGSFSSAILDLNPGTGTYYVSHNSGISASFVVKLDDGGNFVWGRKFTETNLSSWVELSSIGLDSADNVIVAGKYFGSADFSGGISSPLIINTSAITICVVKLTAAGGLVWASGGITTTNQIEVYDIAADDAGNIFLSGYFYGTVDFDPSLATYNVVAASYSGYLVKLNAAGTFDWVNTVMSSTKLYSVTVNSSGEVYAVGYFADTVDVDPGPVTTLFYSSGSAQGLILNYSSGSGALNWAKQVGFGGGINLLEVKLDNQENLCILTTSNSLQTDVNPGPGIYYLPVYQGNLVASVIRLDPQSNFLGSFSLDGPSIDAFDFAIGPSSEFHIIARVGFYGFVYFEPGHTLFNYTVRGNYDAINYKISSTLTPETPQLSALDSTLCLGDSVFIYASGSLNAGDKWFLYDGGCGVNLLDSSVLGNFIVFPSASTTYFIRGEGSASGIGQCSPLAINVNIVPAPTGNANVNACLIDSLTVGDLVISGSNINWYSTPSGGIPLNSGDLLTNGAIYYASQTINGCESTTRASDSVFLFDPVAPIADSLQYFCWNDSSTIGNLQASGNNVQWYSSMNSGLPLFSSTAIVDGTSYFATQEINGCESTIRTQVVVALPMIYSMDTVELCSGSNITFPDGSTAISISADTLQSSLLQAVSGCDSIIDTYVQVIVLSPVVSQSGPTLSSSVATSYQWLDCSMNMQVIPGATNQNFLPTQNGDYAVEINQSGCLDTSACIQYLYLDANDITVSEGILVHPNPASDYIYIQILQGKGNCNIEVRNMLGEVAINQENSNGPLVILNVSHLPNGVYSLYVMNDEGESHVKFIVHD